jgi:SAM-dependent methyltransferase
VRFRHFEELRPVCPLCLGQRGELAPLRIATVTREEPGVVVEGILHCSNGRCLCEYPVVDGIPLLVPEVRGFVANNVLSILARDDLSPAVESLLGDCCGPGSAFDNVRTYLSLYAWDHYGDLDPSETKGEPRRGAVLRALGSTLALASEVRGPVLDLGCSVGRTSFALAERQPGLVLGIDLNVSMLRLAAAARRGQVQYPRRRVGMVYDRRLFAVDLPGADRVDFWACDALALPFAPGTFGTTVAMNLLDCVRSPRDLLAGLRRVLASGGTALLTTPYDWSPSATPVEAWVGGHSQRGELRGAAEPLLRALLTPGAHPQAVDGFAIVGENEDVPWQVRMHERSTVTYRLHALAVCATE